MRKPHPLRLARGARLAVLVPFRNREPHLERFVPYLRNFLEQQEIDARLWIVEQAAGLPFNRGRLLNVGARLAGESADYYALHDVDFLPEAAEYACPSQPLRTATQVHQAAGLRRFPRCYMGGVVSVRREHFELVNGYSNGYWHWGKEDDDFLLRCLFQGLVPYEDREGEYRELPHLPALRTDDEGRPLSTRGEQRERDRMLRRNRQRRARMQRGLSDPGREGLCDVEFRVLERRDEPGHVRVRVEL